MAKIGELTRLDAADKVVHHQLVGRPQVDSAQQFVAIVRFHEVDTPAY